MRDVWFVVSSRASMARYGKVFEHMQVPFGILLHGAALMGKYGDVQTEVYDRAQKCGAAVGVLHTAIDSGSRIDMARMTGYATAELAQFFAQQKPRAVVVMADRFETLAASIAASYQNIPLVHMQGGEHTGNIDEKVRFANTALADWHLVSTHDARENLRGAGVDPCSIEWTGCPSYDLLPGPEVPALKELPDYTGCGGAAVDLTKPYLLVCYHPDTRQSAEVNKQNTAHLLKWVHQESYGRTAVWIQPNMDAGTDAVAKDIREYLDGLMSLQSYTPIRFYRHLPAQIFLRLLRDCQAIVGNSSAGVREAEMMGVKAINIGSRQGMRAAYSPSASTLSLATAVHLVTHGSLVKKFLDAEVSGRSASRYIRPDERCPSRCVAEFFNEKFSE